MDLRIREFKANLVYEASSRTGSKSCTEKPCLEKLSKTRTIKEREADGTQKSLDETEN